MRGEKESEMKRENSPFRASETCSLSMERLRESLRESNGEVAEGIVMGGLSELLKDSLSIQATCAPCPLPIRKEKMEPLIQIKSKSWYCVFFVCVAHEVMI